MPSDVDAVRTIARASRLLERACPELSLPHYRVLAAVADGDERASRVAARLALGKPTISASVDALCRHGLLERSDVVGDQRAVALRLTTRGRAVLADSERAMCSRLETVLTHADDPSAVLAALRDLAHAIDAAAVAVLK